MRRFDWKVQFLVLGVTALAASIVWLAAGDAQTYPGHLTLLAFCAFALLLDRSGSVLSVEAKGSTSFTVHIAAGLLFGPLWAAVVTSVSTVIGLLAEKQPPIKLLFNASQRVVSVTGGLLLYKWVGGGVPAAYLGRDLAAAGAGVQRDLLMFVVVAVFYFLFNAGSVSAAVALTTGRRFSEIWNVNARGVLGYDIAASYLAVMLAFLYVKFDVIPGLGSLGLVVTLVPILVIRHIYGLYRRLQSSGRELLDLMVKAIEARDPYTSGHSIRVATLAKAIAQETKMSAEEVEQVYTAAVLHDVGKIHEEFAPLLRKDSKLTPEETALLQTHSVKSADLVGIISSFRGVIQSAVRSHHERWDGGGYPDGMAGEDIPLGARIIMISDTTDAMTTDRPYRKRLPIEAVVQELQKYRGTQFDPRLVDMVVNSVTVRRVMAELQAGNSTQAGTLLEGGSKRAMPGSHGLLRGRPSWPKIRAF
jgi:HD-GYP domain-containing protein (c-di-GMP phosphodiesterase class II)